jgi:hypothetical protein
MAKWGDRVDTSRCRNCGTEIYSAKSANGSSYPANVFRGDAGGNSTAARALPNKPHTSEECQATQANNAKANTREAVKSVQSDVMGHPDFAKANENMQKASMTGDIAAITAAATHLTETHARLTKELASQQIAAPAAEKPKASTNKYAGKCVGCGNRVESGEGLLAKSATGWQVKCVGCHHG